MCVMKKMVGVVVSLLCLVGIVRRIVIPCRPVVEGLASHCRRRTVGLRILNP